ncbi:MAG TPA: SdrD B-like domain-containing protein [Thermoanaerobaculia bacterium]|nr:SdrD B-like domain-containing protein [Thermoanaerobaculia bacterium]
MQNESRRSPWRRSSSIHAHAFRIVAAAFLGLFSAGAAQAAGILTVNVINGYNLIVDSNVTSPPTYAPSSAYIGASICNTGDAPLANVIAYSGNYNSGGVTSTPGTYPLYNSTGDLAHPQVTNTGNYSLTLESGNAGTTDGTRYIGTLAAGQCRVQYWLFSYPRCVNVNGASQQPPCTASIAGDVKPDDDVSLNYDVWATTTTGIAAPTVNVRRSFTLRNEISASANKIWPNTTSKVPNAYLAAIQSVIGWGTLGPDGQPLTPSNPVYPGQRVITTQGIWYDLGNVGQGFDNDGDLVPDQNAWLQPVGDAGSFDSDCFKMVNVYGVIIVKLKSGGELLIPFQNRLYFDHLPENTGVVGLVYYQFIATDQGCSAVMTPYQEAASGFDNEKFSADFGLSNGLTSGSFGANLTFQKMAASNANIGATLTYQVTATNTTGTPLGAPDLGVPLTIKEAIPAGTTFVAGSATDVPNTNLTEATGTGSYTQSYTDLDGNVDTCTINYNVTSSQYVILYSNNNGATWSLTEPAGVTNIQWLLNTVIALDGGHDGHACVAPNGIYDNGTLETSLPPGNNMGVSFRVTVAATAPPIVCNTAGLGFGPSAPATTAQKCTLINGINSLSGTVFKDDGSGGGIYGNGTKDGTEGGIGAGVIVKLWYDVDGDGVVGANDVQFGVDAFTNAAGAYSFSNLPDGPFIVEIKKYDGVTSNGVNDAVNDTAFGATGYGNTTTDPNLPLTSTQGILKLGETSTTATLAVNIDYPHTQAGIQTVNNVNFGFAPPFRLTKTIAGNPDANADGRADTAIDEGDTFNYTIKLDNRLPSVGRQGPTGCQYTVWATTGANGSPASKAFTNPLNAWDGPNRQVASTAVTGGGLNFMDGTGFSLRQQPGNITKVEALYFGYFSAALTDDTLALQIAQGVSGWTQTFNTALIDSYVGEPATLDPNEAISWDVTALRPGGGTWSWADNFSTLRLQVNPSKASAADQKTFSLDAIGVRVTTDQACVAGPSTTLDPVPLQDSYDTGSVSFVSASPAPTSVNTATGVIQWGNVGPILPGATSTVTVTMRALNITGTRVGACGGSSPPTVNSVCNWAETAFGTNHVLYADGRPANDDSSKIAATFQGKGEIRGTLWKDTNVDGWPDNDGEPRLPNQKVTLYGCVMADGLTMETASVNKTCAAATGGNSWKVIGTAYTNASGAYEFIGLDTGYYIVEVGDTDGVPATGSTSPFGGTQTAEANDSQAVTAGLATNTNGVCVGGCNNTWGDPTANLSAMNLLNSPTAEEIIGGVNFGYNIPSAILYGNIWWDVNADTLQSAGDSGLSGFTVRRYSDPNGDGNFADGTLQATTTTDANGNYSFSGLAAGSYVIVVVPPTLLSKAWIETVETTGGTSSLNNQIPVTVVAGAISGSHNFAYTQSDTSAIGDTLYFDFNGNGVQDSTETGIANITVWLYQDVDRDGSIDTGVDELYKTTVTNGSGQYLFSSLPAGSYIVKVDTSDSDFPTDVTATGDPDLTAASIGDQLFYDLNGNGTKDANDDGIAAVIVNLYADTNNSGTLNAGDSLVASTSTDMNGKYLFTGLPAGRYFVDVDESTLPNSALVITTVDPANTLITLTSSASTTQVLTADAGYSPASNFAMGNRLWHDVDNDGVQDPGEPGIPYVDIVITNGTGTGCPAGCRVTTDAHGFWIVTGLTNGTFNVTVDTTDADFPRFFTVATGTTSPRVATIAGADLMNVDFGYRYTGAGTSPTGSISGRVFLDADGDLAYDVGEARSATTVNLLDSNGNVVATTATAADGTYSFTGVFIGSYAVQAVDKLGTRYSTLFLSAAQSFPNLNVVYTQASETTADSQSSVSVDGIHADLLQDFGYKRFLGCIGDTVYWDVNENGTQDIGEPGFSGVTVRLYDATWSDANADGYYEAGESTESLVSTTTTLVDNPLTPASEGGTYLFTNLPTLAANHYYLVKVDATTLPGSSHTLIADPDTDGTPCTALPNPDVNGDEFPPPSVCDSQKLVVGFLPGNNYLGADFGYRVNGTGFATIGDRLWIDTDGDGIRDNGEIGIDSVSVWMDTNNNGTLDWTDANANGAWDSGEGERWTQTDIDGFYTFTTVADGTYNIKVLTTDPDWPSGLSTTPTFEVRTSNTASRNNAVQVIVGGGVVTSIVDGDPANDPDTCTSCNLNVDFGYRYAGTNTLSGTICTDDASKNGYCGATALTYSGTTTGESPLEGIQVSIYRWTDDGDLQAWSAPGVLDAGDTFVFIGSTSTNSIGDYSFSNLPDNIIAVLSVPAQQNLLLNTNLAKTSVEDANVITRQFYNGTSTNNGLTVTVIARQALNIGGDTDDNIKDLDFAFDPTLNGNLLFDFGDLPASYANTLLRNSGAEHKIVPGSIHLGAAITNEADGTESSSAAADSGDDGVTMVSTVFGMGGSAYVDVDASAAGWLVAWMDFNGDGDFDDADETIIDQSVSAGTNHLSFYIPTTIPNGVTDFFSRFRIYPSRPQLVVSTGPGLDSNFQTMTGEVEDYVFLIPIQPTRVDLVTAEAKQNKNGVVVTWQTTNEVDNLGFDLYREISGGAKEKINPHLITGSAFTTGRTANGPRSYRFVDRKAPSGFVQYWIEDVDLDGTKNMHGPVTPVAAQNDNDSPITTEPDPTLGSVGGIFTTAAGMGVTIPAAATPTTAQRDEQWKLAGVPAVKVIVTQSGWYRVAKSALLAAGFDPGSNPNAISVFTDGVEVPVLVNAKGAGKFDTADTIEFFGRGIDTASTGGRVYYITAKKGAAQRLKSTGGRGNSGSAGAGSYPYTFERIERTVFFSALTNNGDRDNFYGPVLMPFPVTQQLTVANRDTMSGNASLEVTIQGGTAGMEHVVAVELNGSTLGYVRVDSQQRRVDTFPLSGSQLNDGANTLTLTAQNGWYDISVLESVRLTYPHTFRADNDALAFTLASGSSVTVNGFTNDKIRVLDVTDPASPALIDGTIATAADGSKSVSFATTGSGTRTLYAFADNRTLAPAQIAWNEPSSWNAATNGAQLVIVTNRAFLAAAKTLKATRDAQGISTAVVDVQNLYDEFSYGHHSPQAIRDFLERALASWKVKPRYMILLGDASFDPRNYLGIGSFDFVPTKMIATAYLKTSSDDWFADFAGSGIPSVAIGRIPVRTAEQAAGVVSKLVARATPSTEPWAKTVEIVADAPNGFPFDRAADTLATAIPSSFTTDRISVATTPSVNAAVTNAFNRGSLLTTWIGHGSSELWGSWIFSSGEAAALTNGNRTPFVVAMNCLNGMFHDLYTYSMAEGLINNSTGGAIGVWASSAMTGTSGQLAMGSELHRQLLNNPGMTVGDAILLAKQATRDQDTRRTWILFGDPTLKLR